MPYRPRDIYRGRRKFRVPLTIFLFVLAGLLIGAVALFYGLQQYLVYDQTGVRLELPFMQSGDAEQVSDAASAEPSPTLEPVIVQVIYEEPDFSEVDLGGWESLSESRTRFVPIADAVDETKLASAVAAAASGDFTGIVLQLKDESGQLAWASTCELAAAYGTSGTMDYTETVAALHEKGLTAAAQISCCADALMARRNWPVTLQTLGGGAYQDEDGVYWLDPYNRSIRGYLIDLMGELTAMGFDEIILADLYHPVSEEAFSYSVTLQTEPDPVVAVCQMGQRLAESLSGTETAVSVRIDTDSLRDGLGAQTGQDIDIFWRLFARLYCPTSPEAAASDLELCADTMNGGAAATRFVAVCELVPEGMSSYMIE